MNVMNTLDSLFLCKYLISPTVDSLFYTEFLSYFHLVYICLENKSENLKSVRSASRDITQILIPCNK